MFNEFREAREKRLKENPMDAENALSGGAGGIGTPDDMREHLRKFEKAGVDQVTFIQQAGLNIHEHICESLELFASEVMPEFKEREAERVRKKNEELAPCIEAALARKVGMQQLADEDIPTFPALGRAIIEESDEDKSIMDKASH